jgi:putative ABC transport system substrate-binding protein
VRRREFIGLVGAVAACPFIARAQEQTVPMIGFLGHASPAEFEAFQKGLSESGYFEGKNLKIEHRRLVEGSTAQPSLLAADLVRQNVSLIFVTPGLGYVLAAKASTARIPIVFHMGSDPIKYGLVASMNRPGGNITGATNLNVEVGAKRFELLLEIIPAAKVLAVLINPNNPNTEVVQRDLEGPARNRGVQLRFLQASNEIEVDAVFPSITSARVDGLIIAPDGLFAAKFMQLASSSLRYAVPAVYSFRDFAAAGGLMSYGGFLEEGFRVAGVYAGRILRGEKPADLPVHQPKKFDLVINLKTAQVLGLKVPPTLLARANEVIE